MPAEWNDTDHELARDGSAARCVHELFEEQAARTPGAVAVELESQRLTYGELDARANQLAHALVRRGVRPGQVVAVCMERSLEMVVSLYAVLKAGAAYAPLDPSHPSERLAFLAQDLAAPVVLTTTATAPRLDGIDAVLRVDSLEGDLPSTKPPVASDERQLAYVIYTSGSTGKPKGVMNVHSGLFNRLLWMQDAYRLTPADVVLQKTPYTFDVSVWEFFWPLMFGAKLVVARPDGHKDPAYLVEVIRTRGVTTIHFVPSMLGAFLENPHFASCTSLRHVICSGEALPRALQDKLLARLTCGLHNLYGPTEASIDVSHWTCKPEDPRADVPIGRPIWNTRLHVVDDAGNPCPVGGPGELCIAGVGLALGYWKRPDLTADKFVPDPFATEPGARMYRTGDLACWLSEGALAYLGRLDHQVKLRGLRIELGEIEAVLAACAGVASAVVLAREDVPGDKRLVAYVVPSAAEKLDLDAVRVALARTLPEYMIPSAFVSLERMPLTTSGKADRKALPAPDYGAAATTYVAPATPTEERLAQIWSALLAIERIGAHDDFFRLGGHSLLATRVVSRVRSLLGVELPLHTVFDGGTLSALAARIDAQRGRPEERPLSRVARSGTVAASFAQQRLWFLDQLDPGSSTYNLPFVVRLDGELDVDALGRAISALVARHEPLRTTFVSIDGQPHQQIHPAADVPLKRECVATNEQLRAVVNREVSAPFDLATGPVLRAALVGIDGTHTQVLVLCIHHVATDGWSGGVIARELSALYDAFCAGRQSPLAPLPIDYADFAVWQRSWLVGEELERQISFWKDHLAGAPTALELATDRPRPAIRQLRGGSVPVRLSRDTASGIHALCAREGATPFMVLLAAYQTVLARWSRQSDIVVGAAIANRTREEMEDLVGFFVNTLALRTRFDGDPTFTEVIRRVKRAALAAYAHQDVPFERVVDALGVPRDSSRTPVFQAIFALQNAAADELRLGGISVREEPTDFASAKFDLTLSLGETAEGIAGDLQYDAALFNRATIERFVDHLRGFLEKALDAPDERVAAISLLSASERHTVVSSWNATKTTYPSETSLAELVEAQVDRTPDAIAVEHGASTMTYRELDAKANRLAHHLRGLGVVRGSFVALFVERSSEMIVAMLAILKAGGAYVPLDPSYPADRIASMLEDAKPRVVIGGAAQLARLPASEAARVDLDERSTVDRDPDSRLAPVATGADLAYLMFTSGSTGRPKGACIPQRAVSRLVLSTNYVALAPHDRIAQASNASFDAATFEVWGALVNGARLVVFDKETVIDAALLGPAIEAAGITTLFVTTALFNQIAELRPQSFSKLTNLMVGGEQVNVRAVRQVLPHKPTRLLNVYGPTETTTFASWFLVERLEPEATSIPIGRPIANTTIYVLDELLEPAGIGVPGELYIGGDGNAYGYLARPALTAEKFVPDPFSAKAGATLYRTGDLARLLPDGNVDFLGRIDHQVKVRGFRIELGELEAAIAGTGSVREVLVLAREDRPGDKRLVAYVSPKADTTLEIPVLVSALRRVVPEYMVPSAFVVLDVLPLTPNGKVDRKRLPAPDLAVGSKDYVAPQTPLEQAIVATCQEVLGVERVGMADNFFDLGGHSLLATQVASRLRAQLGVEVPIRLLFDAKTLAELAHGIEAAKREAPAGPTKMVRRRAL